MIDHACAKCEKTFVSRYKLNQHNNKWHEERKCDECGKMFKKGYIARHLKVHTDNDGEFTCHICAKTFRRTDSLQGHIKRCHEEKMELYKCNTCEKTFTQKGYLKLHMNIHTGAPRKQCKYCSKDFSAGSNLLRHVKKCHPTPKVIENSQGFIMLEKSPERNPVKDFKPKKKKTFNCETCDFKSQRKYNLEVHMKNKHQGTPKKQGRKRKLPSEWSEATKKVYARRLKKSFKERVKDLGLEDEIKDLFKRDKGLDALET